MSAGFFNNVSYQTTPYKMHMEDISHKNTYEQQATLSIHNSDFNKISPTNQYYNNNNNNIRRTLSYTDMSSPKLLQNNGFNLKKVQSSHQLQALGEDNHEKINNNDHDDHNKGPAFEEIWSSIQADKKSWGSILSPIDGPGSGSRCGSGQLPAPYIHPLVKRSASSLSEKSLEICTESLGSETGSDGFSYSSSEPEDSDKEQEQEVEEEKEKEQEGSYFRNATELSNCKFNSYNKGPTSMSSKRSMMVPPGRPSFPPPLPSLANRDGGSNLHIRSHRHDGRLVVEAVSVPSLNCFRAQRQDGRLLLTLNASDDHDHDQDDNLEQECDEIVQDDGDEEVVFDDDEDEKSGIVVIKDYGNEIEEGVEVVEEEELDIGREVINVQRSCPTLTMTSKHLNKSTWPRGYNRSVIKTFDDEGEDVTIEKETEIRLLSQSRMSTSTVLNVYEYYWRRTNSPNATTAVAVLNPLAGQQNNNIFGGALQVGKDTKENNKELLFAAHNTKGVALEQQDVVLVKAARRRGRATRKEEKGEYLVPFMLRGCKDHKKSFFLLDSYCIAT